jgi:hypothetical protein
MAVAAALANLVAYGDAGKAACLAVDAAGALAALGEAVAVRDYADAAQIVALAS